MTAPSKETPNTPVATEGELTLKAKIARLTYKILYWGKHKVPFGARSVLGVLFMIGGVFGFLPVLGFWMLPLGVAFIMLDIPWTAHKADAWMDSLKRRMFETKPPGSE